MTVILLKELVEEMYPLGKGYSKFMTKRILIQSFMREVQVILYYFGFPLTDEESDQKYSVFTAPYAAGSLKPDLKRPSQILLLLRVLLL